MLNESQHNVNAPPSRTCQARKAVGKRSLNLCQRNHASEGPPDMPRARKPVNESPPGDSPPVDATGRSADDQPVNPLGRLVQQTMDARGITAGQVAKRGGIDRSVVYDVIRRKEYKQTPQLSTLEGLARGLGLPLELIKEKAAEAVGIVVSRHTVEGVDVFLAELGELSGPRRRRALQQATELVRSWREEGT